MRRHCIIHLLEILFCIIVLHLSPNALSMELCTQKQRNELERTLATAIQDGNLRLVDFFLNRYSYKNYSLLLFYALNCERFDFAERFLAQGVQVNALCSKFAPTLPGDTLCKCFSNYCRLKPTKWLLQQGANPNLHATNHSAPLEFLCAHPRLERFYLRAFKMMRLLCKYGADPNIPVTLRTCLHAVIGQSKKVKNKSAMIVLLIRAGADVNAQNIEGKTPLHLAVMEKRSIVPYLLNRGAKKDIQDKQGRKAIDLVKNNPDLYAMLASDELPPMPRRALKAEKKLNKLKQKIA